MNIGLFWLLHVLYINSSYILLWLLIYIMVAIIGFKQRGLYR